MGVLPLESVIGFDGKVNGGLVLHPDGRTLIYPLGATVVVKELGDTSKFPIWGDESVLPPNAKL